MTSYRDFPPCPPGTSPQAWAVECKTIRTLDNLGLGYTNKANQYQGLVIEDARCNRVVEGQQERLRWVEMDLRVNPLPFGVDVDKIANERVRRTLKAVTAGDVTIITDHGVTIRVDFEKKAGAYAHLNFRRDMVPYRLMPQSPGIWLPVGVSVQTNKPLFVRLDTLDAHLLIAGITRYGKSTWMQIALATMALVYSPEEFQLLLMDAKNGQEFRMWQGLEHLMTPVCITPEEALEGARQLKAEMARRSAIIGEAGTRSFIHHNHWAERNHQPPLPLLLVVVDEFGTIMNNIGRAGSEFERLMVDVANQAAGAGVLVWCACQIPSAKMIPTTIRRNLHRRLVFAMGDETSGEMADMPEAGEIRHKGRFYTSLVHPESPEPDLVQGWWVKESNLQNLIQFLVRRSIAQAGSPRLRRQLTDDELRMCQIARDRLDGNFTVGDDKAKTGIYGAVGPKKRGGFSKRLIEDTGRNLEARGLLAKVGGENGQGWVMLPELLDIVKSDEQIKEGEGR